MEELLLKIAEKVFNEAGLSISILIVVVYFLAKALSKAYNDRLEFEKQAVVMQKEAIMSIQQIAAALKDTGSTVEKLSADIDSNSKNSQQLAGLIRDLLIASKQK